MPLENLFSDARTTASTADRRRALYESFGVVGNPFPSAAQTSSNPHMSIAADAHVDSAVMAFYADRRSHVIAITASQGIGKTNLLSAYENALKEKLAPRGFFVIRYIADPEPTFDPLIRSVFEHLGEDHLRLVATKLCGLESADRESYLDNVRTADVKAMFTALAKPTDDEASLDQRVNLAHQWLLGLPLRKAHREELDVKFRLDTVESKTRALRDVVYLSAELKVLEGVFLLLDELEKQDFSRSKTVVLQYLSALRAMIDALPKYLFLMAALTTDALERYREMFPALKGRLADQVVLPPISTVDQALEYRDFYLEHARKEAAQIASPEHWKVGKKEVVSKQDALDVFEQLKESSSIEGVRQRDYLNQLHKKADAAFGGVVG